MNFHTLQQLPPTNHQKKLGFLAIKPYICMDCNCLMCKMRKGMGTIKKSVALVAHDNMKRDLVEWVDWNWELLLSHHLVCTGTTGKMVATTLMERHHQSSDSFDITLLKSGPLGGDQQLGSMIAEGKISALIFFWDPMQAQPHDVDVKALLRLATLYNVPTAINRSSADFIISSSLMSHEEYKPVIKDYTSYIQRTVK